MSVRPIVYYYYCDADDGEILIFLWQHICIDTCILDMI